MADNKVKTEIRVETRETDLTKKQQEDAKAIEERKKKAADDAESARAEAKQKAEEKQKEQELQAEKDAQSEELQEAVLGAAAAAVSLASKKGIRWKDFLSGLAIGFLCGILFLHLLGGVGIGGLNDDHDVVIEDEGFYGYTAADFENSILGAASEHQELIVMEQPLSIQTTITKAGLGNLPIFSKVKNVTYYGSGIYTVDLSGISGSKIKVDQDAHTVEIRIPHAVLQYIQPDLSMTEFDDTEKGWLAFGDIALTAEEQNELEQSVESAMRERLEEKEIFENADKLALLKTWEIFQPLVTAVSPEFTVEMVFE